jgi:choline dehydrogenase-like flavoprotein
MTKPAAKALPDLFRAGMAGGWAVIDASTLARDETLEADVAIVGTGAGGGTAAEILAQAGLKVILIEEGPLRTSSDFRMRESEAYPDLYQESAGRRTADKAIGILQGRCVGGSTTVNWTSSFRTPHVTLLQWAKLHGVDGLSSAELAPYFARMEARLSIAPWEVPPNENNAVLARGAAKIGIPAAAIRRNVLGCWNLGYCGMGCPTNAKQSMLVTTIPAALDRGATLVTRARAQAFTLEGDRVAALACVAMDARGVQPTARRITVRARAFVAAGGAIGSPALLLRSAVPDPHGIVGRRTFLHPVVISVARMPERVAAFSGAPQTIYSDHFIDSLPPDGPIGFKLEAPPIHPILGAITVPSHGARHAQWMRELPQLQVLIALLRDGFHPESAGGRVVLQSDGTPALDYPLTPYVWDGVRRALATMAQIQFAAGATHVMPVHGDGTAYERWDDARAAIAGFALAPLATPVVSAHVMGGCPIGRDPKQAVVDASGRHHHLANLYVLDGSLFPTSIGANPQLSIYGVVAKLADGLAASLAPAGADAPRTPAPAGARAPSAL